MNKHLKTIVSASLALGGCRESETREIPDTGELSYLEQKERRRQEERIRWEARAKAYEATRNEPLIARDCLEGKRHPLLSASVAGPEAVMADPEVEALADQFCQEARRQINAVITAGGYCRLPERNEYEGSTLEGADNNDMRLGAELTSIVLDRNSLFTRRFHDENARSFWLGRWIAMLNRVTCEPSEPQIREELIPEGKRRRAVLQKLNTLRKEFGKHCALRKGGYFKKDGSLIEDTEIEDDPLLIRRLLVKRGRAIDHALPEDFKFFLRKKWRQTCTSTSAAEIDEPLSETELHEFWGSHLLVDETLHQDDGHTWICHEGGEPHLGSENIIAKPLDYYWSDDCGRVFPNYSRNEHRQPIRVTPRPRGK